MLTTRSGVTEQHRAGYATEPVVQVQHLSKVYSSDGNELRALDNVSLAIQSGEMVAIMGPSGSGKSTLMTILGLLEASTEGHYWLDGADVSTLSRRQQAHARNSKLGFVFQNFNLLPRLSVLKNVELPLVYAGVGAREREQRACEALTAVGLQDKLYSRPNQLSGGQKQRVAIARALVSNPSMVLADEPTGALDRRTGREIIALFRKLNCEQGLTIVVVTHDPEVARQTDRVIGLCDGRIDPGILEEHYGSRVNRDETRNVEDAETWRHGDEQHFAAAASPWDLSPDGDHMAKDGETDGEEATSMRDRYASDSPQTQDITSVRRSLVSGQLLKEQMLMALDSLRANTFRSLLTMLGIIIGTATLVAVLSLGNALQSNVFEQFVDLGTRRIAVLAGDPQAKGARDIPGYGLLSMRDYTVVKSLVERHPDIFDAVVPEVLLPLDVRAGSASVRATVVGTTREYQVVQTTQVEHGRFLSASDEQQRARVAVLGGVVAKHLFGDDPAALRSAVGQTVEINGQSLQIIGVIKSLGGHNPSDNQVLMPLSTMRLRVVGDLDVPGRGVRLDSILVSVQSDQVLDPAEALLRSTLRAARGVDSGDSDDFQLNMPTQVLSVLNGINSAITGFIGVVAGISLVVGGIGIMNIMLVAVTERTREIGVRKALGATDGDILGQFLMEALAVSLVGGLIGISIALGLILLIGALTGIAAPIAWNAVGLALLFASAVGIGFGLYPARRAARLLPIEALRYE